MRSSVFKQLNHDQNKVFYLELSNRGYPRGDKMIFDPTVFDKTDDYQQAMSEFELMPFSSPDLDDRYNQAYEALHILFVKSLVRRLAASLTETKRSPVAGSDNLSYFIAVRLEHLNIHSSRHNIDMWFETFCALTDANKLQVLYDGRLDIFWQKHLELIDSNNPTSNESMNSTTIGGSKVETTRPIKFTGHVWFACLVLRIMTEESDFLSVDEAYLWFSRTYIVPSLKRPETNQDRMHEAFRSKLSNNSKTEDELRKQFKSIIERQIIAFRNVLKSRPS